MSELEKYQAIMKEFERTTEKIKSIVSQIKRSSTSLESWNNLVIIPTKIGYPLFTNSLDLSSWPTAEEIDDLLSKWHCLKLDLENQYRKLDSAIGISTPADIIRGLNVP